MTHLALVPTEHPHADHIRRLVDEAPPFSDRQLARLAAILGGVADEPATPLREAA